VPWSELKIEKMRIAKGKLVLAVFGTQFVRNLHFSVFNFQFSIPRLAFLAFAFFVGLSFTFADEPPKPADIGPTVQLLELVLEADTDTAQKCLAIIAAKVQSKEVAGTQLEALRSQLAGPLGKILAGKSDGPLYADAAILAASLKDPAGTAAARKLLAAAVGSEARRLQAIDALIAAGDETVLSQVARILAERKANSPAFRSGVLLALGRLDDPQVAQVVLAGYAKLEPDLQPKAIELLTQRPAWSKPLLVAIGNKEVPAEAVSANQVAKLLSSKDEELTRLVTAKWGSVRTQRNPQREQVIAQVRETLKKSPGDPHKGHAVFKRVCAQCHKIHGEGQEVGPDITANGRASYEQLLSNVLDPSLVIGASYQARTIITDEGRVLTGLLVEENDHRVVLKVQGGKLETVPRGEIDTFKVSELSLMPEELEKQLAPGELEDLFAFLVLDKPPSDPTARKLPGAK
jgi:putative heme-binding domain-containing protein